MKSIQYYFLFLTVLGISCSNAKNTSSSSTTARQKKILPTVISYQQEETVPREIQIVFDSCFTAYSIKLITIEEGKSLSRNAMAEVYRTASQKPDISAEEMQRMIEDVKYAYNLVSFKLNVEPQNIFKEISWSINSWPVNKSSKKPVIHKMPSGIIQQDDWRKAISLTVDSVLHSRLLN